jgi:hypothetical protein
VGGPKALNLGVLKFVNVCAPWYGMQDKLLKVGSAVCIFKNYSDITMIDSTQKENMEI